MCIVHEYIGKCILSVYLSIYHLSMSSVIQLSILSGGTLSNILEVQFLGGSISVSFREGQGNHSYLTHLFSLRNLFLNVTLHEILTCTTDKDGTPPLKEAGGKGRAWPSLPFIPSALCSP